MQKYRLRLASARFFEKRRAGLSLAALSLTLVCVLPGQSFGGIDPTPSEQRIELIFWESVQDSTSSADYEAYLEAYPQGKFAPLARARAQQYAAPKAPQATPKAVQVDEALSEAPPEVQATVSASASEMPPTPPTSSPPLNYLLEPVEGPYRLIEMSNIREQPSASAPIIIVLNAGDPLDVTDRVSGRNWYKILLDDGSFGYVYGDLVQRYMEPAVESAAE